MIKGHAEGVHGAWMLPQCPALAKCASLEQWLHPHSSVGLGGLEELHWWGHSTMTLLDPTFVSFPVAMHEPHNSGSRKALETKHCYFLCLESVCLTVQLCVCSALLAAAYPPPIAAQEANTAF